MSAEARERLESRRLVWPSQEHGSAAMASRQYAVVGTDDEAEALAAVLAAAPQTVVGLARDSVELRPLDARVWDAVVEYRAPGAIRGHRVPQTGDRELRIDFTTHARTVRQGLAYTSRSQGAPNLYGAIGVSDSGVAGAEVLVPAMRIEYACWWAATQVTGEFLAGAYACVGTVNDAPFTLTAESLSWAFAAHELLLTGIRASIREAGDWAFVYEFLAAPNRVNVELGNVTIPLVHGHDIIDVLYRPRDVGGVPLMVPVHAYAIQVYPARAFSALIPT